MSDYLKRAEELKEEIIMNRRAVHRCPETGLHLPRTKTYVMEKLREMGYEPVEIGDSGVTVTVGGKKPGKVFLLRGDMDALPIMEETGLSFASSNGCMHACGHDCHTAMMLGAAKLLKESEDELSGTVKLLFQPAEETLEGAKSMVENGILENPKVDAAMMIHVNAGYPVPSGVFAFYGWGPSYSSADWFRIDIQGKGGHGANPDLAKSPIDVLCEINSGIHEIVAMRLAPAANAVMTVGEIHGGTTGNIIPDTAYMCGTIRTLDEKVREMLKTNLEEMANHTAVARGCTAEVTYTNSAPAARCDEALTKEMIGVVQNILGPQSAACLRDVADGAFATTTGTEDFAYITKEVPSAIALLMCGSPQEGYRYPLHHPKADFKEEILYLGSAVYAQAAKEWLENHTDS